MRGEIHGAREGKGRARALEQTAGLGIADDAEAKQDGARGCQQNAGGNDVFGAQPVKRRARDDREGRVGVIIEPDERTDPERSEPEGAG